MGLDAKGRNFSAPRLTPGKTSEFLCYGSPEMIVKQNREIAIMEARARRYGFGGIRSINSQNMGDSSSISTGLSYIPYGTPSDQNAVAVTAKPITDISNPNNHSTMANSAAGAAYSKQKASGAVAVIAITAIIFACFGPFIIAILAFIFELIFE